MAAAAARFGKAVGSAVVKAGEDKASTWFTPHMAAASGAILDRIPLVDFTLEVRDARIPVSSQYQLMRKFPSSRRIIVLNKTDLADRSQTQEWIRHFHKENCICYGINSHNKDNIKEFLNFVQANARELNSQQSKFTTTVMLVGIPNVGKSALANSLHQIGRISAAEKGKLKHATVSPLPGETKDITSLKIASHPNIYILDTPGVLLPDSLDIEMGSKLALTGAITDSLVDVCELAQYFLSIFNLGGEHKRWETLISKEEDNIPMEHKTKLSDSSQSNMKKKKLFYTDHTQDFVVRDVRRILLKKMLSHKGNLEDADELANLIDSQLMALPEAFRLSLELDENVGQKVAMKLLNLYRTVMSCFYQDGQPERALEMYEKMKRSGFLPDSVTFTTVFAACTRLLDLDRGKNVHEDLLTSGYELDGSISSALVDMYGKCGCLDRSREVFEQIPRKSVVSWNSMISGYSLKGDIYSCLDLFRRMNEERVRPTSTTISILLTACSKSAMLEEGKFIHGIPKTNVVAWNVMILGYVMVGCFFEALRVFQDMKDSNVSPDAVTFTSVLPACSQLAALEVGREIHYGIIEKGLEYNQIVMGALLDMYAKCGAVDEACRVFDKLPERDFVSWTSMITAYGSHGQAIEALKLSKRWNSQRQNQIRVTFLAIISACSHAGLVDEGCYYFDKMTKKYGIKPTLEHHSCLIDLLGRAGRLREAYELLLNNPTIKEDVGLLSTLLSACYMHKNLQLGEEIARLVLKKDPDDSATYMVLSNLCASAGKWGEVRKIRQKMKELGLKKNPGCSWIEVEKRVHSFFAEDDSPPEAELVYECLANIYGHVEREEALL